MLCRCGIKSDHICAVCAAHICDGCDASDISDGRPVCNACKQCDKQRRDEWRFDNEKTIKMKLLNSSNVVYAKIEASDYEEEEKLSEFIKTEVEKNKMRLISSRYNLQSGVNIKEVLIFSLASAQKMRDMINNKSTYFDHGVDYHEL